MAHLVNERQLLDWQNNGFTVYLFLYASQVYYFVDKKYQSTLKWIFNCSKYYVWHLTLEKKEEPEVDDKEDDKDNKFLWREAWELLSS